MLVIIASSLSYPSPPGLWKKIISKKLSNFLESNGALSYCQHGFWLRLSTESALIVVSDIIFSNIYDKKISLLTLCDLSKAFNSVSHTSLLKKWAKLNIDSYWFKIYLANRTQSVILKTIISTKENICFGVPQGSILGTVLFNIFVNDIYVSVTDCKLIQYADDTIYTQWFSGQFRYPNKKCGKYTYQSRENFLENGLMVNPTKTQCIFLGDRQLLSRIPENVKNQFDDTSNCASSHVDNLCLHMDRYMMFDKHVNELTKKDLVYLYT